MTRRHPPELSNPNARNIGRGAQATSAILGLSAITLWARAGGGDGYHSGGSSSSSGSSDGFQFSTPSHRDYGPSPYADRGGGGGSVLTLVVFALVLLFVWIIFVRIQRRRGAKRYSEVNWAALNSTMSGKSIFREKEIKVKPAALSPATQRLLRALPKIFVDIQMAWSVRDLERVHHLVSDGVHSRWEIQLDLMHRENRRNWVRDPKLHNAQVLSERSAGAYESVNIRIDASLRDMETRANDAAPEHWPEPSQFSEVWSFTRKIRPTGGNSESSEYGEQCLHCGASLRESQGVKCHQCGSMLNSGAYDWVLAEITQSDEWREPSQTWDAALVESQTQGDPLSAQELEDRAATVFVRLIQALLQNRPGLLRPYATESLVAALQQGTATWIPRSLQRLAVGKVEMQSVVVEDGFIRAGIRVRFVSGRNTMLPDLQPQDLDLHFTKSVGTGMSSPLNSLNCPQCGAPVGGSEQARCQYCGETLNNPALHWVLDHVT